MIMFLISYDIQDDNLRRRIAQKLVEIGFERIQLSVFVGLETPLNSSSFAKLVGLVSEKDSILLFQIGKEAIRNVRVIGKQELDIPFLLGERSTLFF